jgi:glycosyltransferase involved in cell wall biosynthesis
LEIWLVKIHEPIPFDPSDRPWRTGSLLLALDALGHRVTWMTSDFDHVRKASYSQSGEVQLGRQSKVVLLPGRPFTKGRSPRRVLHHRDFVQQFKASAASRAKPDLIITSMPTIVSASVAVEFGRQCGAATVVDVRDLWPDAFVPTPLARFLLKPARFLSFKLRRSLRHADALVASSEGYLKWALDRAGRPAQPLDRSFTIASTYQAPETPTDERFVVVFLGSFTGWIDLDTPLAAARILRDESHIRFVFAGDGDFRDELIGKAADLPNVTFPGWIDSVQANTLTASASICLVPYFPREEFSANLTNKMVDALAAGVPIASSLPSGVLADLLRHQDAGFTYSSADDLAAELRRLSQDRPRLQRMRVNIRELRKARADLFPSAVMFADHVVAIADAVRRSPG